MVGSRERCFRFKGKVFFLARGNVQLIDDPNRWDVNGGMGGWEDHHDGWTLHEICGWILEHFFSLKLAVKLKPLKIGLKDAAPIQEICHLNQPLIFRGELAVSFREYDSCWNGLWLIWNFTQLGGFKDLVFVSPYFGRWSNLISIFFKWVSSTTTQLKKIHHFLKCRWK